MTLDDLVTAIGGFSTLAHTDRFRFFAFHAHEYAAKETFTVADLRAFYKKFHFSEPTNYQSLLKGMVDRREVLSAGGGRFKLEARAREDIRARVPVVRPQSVVVEKTLLDLPATLSDFNERAYLYESLLCYKAGAFRAAIVMTWNLAYDRLCNWVFKHKLAEFNASIPIRYAKEKLDPIGKRDDFAEMKESQVLEVCRHAGITSVSLHKVLKDKLDLRNVAAHPSTVVTTQLSAEAYIGDLIPNIVQHFP